METSDQEAREERLLALRQKMEAAGIRVPDIDLTPAAQRAFEGKTGARFITRSEVQDGIDSGKIDPTGASGFWENAKSLLIRAAAGMQYNQRSAKSVVEKAYGEGNVAFFDKKDEDIGGFVITDPETGQGYILDPKHMFGGKKFFRGLIDNPEKIPGQLFAAGKQAAAEVAGDVADVSGELVETIPGMVASASGPAAGAVADAGATVGRSVIAEAIPGGAGLDRDQLATRARNNILMGLGGEGVSRGLGALNKGVRQGQFAGKRLMNEAGLAGDRSAKAAKRADRAARHNIDISAAQVTGGPSAVSFEAVVRQSPGGKAIFHHFDVRQANQLHKAVNKTIKATAGPDVGAVQAGKAVDGAWGSYRDGLVKDRSDATRSLFKEASADAGPTTESIPLNNFVEELKIQGGKVKSRASGHSADIKQKGINAQLRNVIGEDNKPIIMPIDEFQVSLSDFGSSAQGSGQFIKDLEKAKDKHIAQKLLDALRRDLDDAIEAGVPGAEKLRLARDKWRDMSYVIDDAKDVILEKATELNLKGAPDGLASEVLSKSYTPEQLRKTMAILNRADPVAADKLKGAALREILEKANPKPNTQLAQGEALMNPGAFAKAAGDNDKKVAALFMDDKKGLAAWNELRLIAQSASDRAGMIGSPTEPLKWFREILSGLSPGSGTVNLKQSLGTISSIGTAGRMAKWMTDPAKRDLFLGLAKPGKKTTRQLTRMATHFLELIAQDEQEDSRPIQFSGPLPPDRHGASGSFGKPGFIKKVRDAGRDVLRNARETDRDE